MIKNKKDFFYSKEFYIFGIIIFITYLPFVVYVFQTDFAPIIYIINRLDKIGSINRTLDFWGAQIGLYSPLFFILFCYLIVKVSIDFFKKKEIENNFYFALISLLPFIYILQKSFKNKLEANWALFIYGGMHPIVALGSSIFIYLILFIGQKIYEFRESRSNSRRTGEVKESNQDHSS